MTIKKTYEVQVEYPNGEILHVKRKGITSEQTEVDAQAEFMNADYVYVTGRTRDLDPDRFMSKDPMLFGRRNRNALYQYRHKGKKKKGRKNYPRMRRRQNPNFTITYTETYSEPVSKALKAWEDMMSRPPEPVSVQ